jgi:hypothetical protein
MPLAYQPPRRPTRLTLADHYLVFGSLLLCTLAFFNMLRVRRTRLAAAEAVA